MIGRKVWLFSDTPKGATASAQICSLVETAKVNGWEPYTWLRHVLERLPLAQSVADYEALVLLVRRPRGVQPREASHRLVEGTCLNCNNRSEVALWDKKFNCNQAGIKKLTHENVQLKRLKFAKRNEQMNPG